MHGHILVWVGHVMWVEMIRRSSVGVEAAVVRRMSVPISIGVTTSNLDLIVLLGQLFTLMIGRYGPLRTVSPSVELESLTVVVWWVERSMGMVMLSSVKWLLICLIHHVVVALVDWRTLVLNETLLCRLIFVNFTGHLGGMRSVGYPLLRFICHRRCIFFIED